MNLRITPLSQFMDFLRIQLEYFRINYDEKKVPAYTLPDPLKMQNGCAVACINEWWASRRPEILTLFKEFVYGSPPDEYENMQTYRISSDSSVFSGLATRKEITIFLADQSENPLIDLLLYVPNHVAGPAPTFLGLNFFGNHTIHSDPGITIKRQWHRKKRSADFVYMQPSEKTRGANVGSWPVEKILQNGFALATAYYGDLEPDYPNGYCHGVRSFFLNRQKHKEVLTRNSGFRTSKECLGSLLWDPVHDWGAIGVWAWGLSRIMDYLESDVDIQASKVALFGHSRLGKTALWAGAQDDRFAVVISNNSGCGGAALSRRCFGETIRLLNLVNPHWFSTSFQKFNGKVDQLPVDQHMLISLLAPRPVYVASAEKDLPADPLGEFCSLINADPVYRLFDLTGLGTDQMPSLNEPVWATNGYHVRAGDHEVTDYDWEKFLGFTKSHFERN